MMQSKSFGSVRVYEPDVQAVAGAIDALTEHLSAFREVIAVYLIGSYDRGDFGPFSDVDVVVIVETSTGRFIDRSEKYLPARFPVPLDLFVYTRSEVLKMKESGHPFWREIERRHTVLLDRGRQDSPGPHKARIRT